VTRQNAEVSRPSGVFGGVYAGKRVLVTGHTGFKGSWLTLWLMHLGADVVGLSLDLPSSPCNFEIVCHGSSITDSRGDIRDRDTLQRVFDAYKPEAVFHLAAQPLVRRSHEDPGLTFETNVMGTVRVLDCLRSSASVEAAVIITSDKCYQNQELSRGYTEDDRLGGDDPYSASKAGAEIAFSSYVRSYFGTSSGRTGPCLSTTRAGNVIGGGDWALGRVVPDCVRAWAASDEPTIRAPMAVRPWQHVLEALSGYLALGGRLLGRELHAESFNFGPSGDEVHSVEALVTAMAGYWGQVSWHNGRSDHLWRETDMLRLNSDKALALLGWRSVLSFEETAQLTAEWYKAYYSGTGNMKEFSLGQIDAYVASAQQRCYPWASA